MMDALALLFWLQAKVLPPSDLGSNVQLVLRWIHFLAGITWIGLLYFFNLVNVPAMKAFDAPTKGKYLPNVVAPALWWFRWGAVVTVLAGFVYWVLILDTEPPNDPGSRTWTTAGLWFVVVAVTWAIQYFLVRLPALAKNGWVFGAVVLILAAAMGGLIVHQVTAYENVSNRVVSIGVGGGLGLFMMLNVWGIIWPIQKRILAWTKENAEKGTAIPPEAAALGRRAFLASRANAWLSIAMLFFMAAASHYPLFVGG
jgi:uncharacterized membrane protein